MYVHKYNLQQHIKREDGDDGDGNDDSAAVGRPRWRSEALSWRLRTSYTCTCVRCGVNMMRREKTRTQILDSKGVDVAAGVGAGDARRKQEKKDNNYFMHIIKTKVS